MGHGRQRAPRSAATSTCRAASASAACSSRPGRAGDGGRRLPDRQPLHRRRRRPGGRRRRARRGLHPHRLDPGHRRRERHGGRAGRRPAVDRRGRRPRGRGRSPAVTSSACRACWSSSGSTRASATTRARSTTSCATTAPRVSPRRRRVRLTPLADLLALTAHLVDIPSESHHEAGDRRLSEAELPPARAVADARPGRRQPRGPHRARARRSAWSSPATPTPCRPTATSRPARRATCCGAAAPSDMKCGLAVMLALAAAVPEPAVDVTYVFYEAEEVAARSTASAACSRERPDLLAGDVAAARRADRRRDRGRLPGHDARCASCCAEPRAHTARPWMGRNAIHRLGPAARRPRPLRGAPAGDRRLRVPRGAPGRPGRGRRGRQRRARRGGARSSTTASRPTAPRPRPRRTCGSCWRRGSRTATSSRSSDCRRRRRAGARPPAAGRARSPATT